MYVVKVAAEARERIRAAMAAEGVATSVITRRLPGIRVGNERAGALCGDDDRKLMTLPTFLDLAPEAQQRVAAALERARARPARGGHRSVGVASAVPGDYGRSRHCPMRRRPRLRSFSRRPTPHGARCPGFRRERASSTGPSCAATSRSGPMPGRACTSSDPRWRTKR